MKLYTRLADAFTPLAKVSTPNMRTRTLTTQFPFTAVQVHYGYKCQRLYRDARIFSIYEGTTQLQVVAAVRYITNGTYLSIMKEMLANDVCDCMKDLKARVERLVALYEEALEKVKASECQDTIDFLARRLYNMTAGIIESLLLIERCKQGTRTVREVGKQCFVPYDRRRSCRQRSLH